MPTGPLQALYAERDDIASRAEWRRRLGRERGMELARGLIQGQVAVAADTIRVVELEVIPKPR